MKELRECESRAAGVAERYSALTTTQEGSRSNPADPSVFSQSLTASLSLQPCLYLYLRGI